MADRPILFSAPMVRALLNGTKTQTRRVIKPVGSLGNGWPMYPHYINGKRSGDTSHPEFSDLTSENGGVPLFGGNSPICPGDRLYVREHWYTWGIFDDLAPSKLTGKEGVNYIADGHERPLPGKFRQAMHMPRWASRITLTVTDVRVERLQEIDDADALAEGVETTYGESFYQPGASHRRKYWLLWEHLNGPGSWEANPWVAAYTFTVERANIDSIGKAT